MVTLEEAEPRMIANNIEPHHPTHPGTVIKDELDYLNISAAEAAERMGVDLKTVEDVLGEKEPMTLELAMMFEALIGVPSDTMLRMQIRYDTIMARRNKGFMKKLEKIRRVAAVL